MTPKQEAKELIAQQFDVIAKASNYKGLKSEGEKKFYLIEKIAKECSVITLNKILNILNPLTLEYDYWIEVKKELK